MYEQPEHLRFERDKLSVEAKLVLFNIQLKGTETVTHGNGCTQKSRAGSMLDPDFRLSSRQTLLW